MRFRCCCFETCSTLRFPLFGCQKEEKNTWKWNENAKLCRSFTIQITKCITFCADCDEKKAFACFINALRLQCAPNRLRKGLFFFFPLITFTVNIPFQIKTTTTTISLAHSYLYMNKHRIKLKITKKPLTWSE